MGTYGSAAAVKIGGAGRGGQSRSRNGRELLSKWEGTAIEMAAVDMYVYRRRQNQIGVGVKSRMAPSSAPVIDQDGPVGNKYFS